MILILFLPLVAFADSELHLGPAYKVNANPPADSAMDGRYVVVERSGVRYKRFSGPAGDLYVLDSQQVSRASIESGQCFDAADVRQARGHEADTVALTQAEGKLSGSEVKAYAGLIQDTTYNKCNDYQTARVKKPSLDLGLSKTVTDPNGTRKTYRLFNMNLKPNLNLGGQF